MSVCFTNVLLSSLLLFIHLIRWVNCFRNLTYIIQQLHLLFAMIIFDDLLQRCKQFAQFN